ncbi:MAG: ligase-associated DNA damage response endonuclease PdeM [Rhodoplanes sp.]|uniref:ligase-associated DNA damage response endonuclease PdeM n=1 Tax=Rhodoplanes sp. TaxID=1968906 RepID=UPI0018062C68|nr:ligase-associated DNA damage response endonuclease PdeM [Rhodoplanes sp.]NVO12854.1 ligase-associated DNA damage response endonuclease PdeM [Rhodoplanes sp.]
MDARTASWGLASGEARAAGTMLTVAGVPMVADLSGALWWPDRRMLLVADLHLEKGSACASRGSLLPPFDTAETLEQLAWVIGFYDPSVVVALGDSFHDTGGADRLAAEARAHLVSLQRGRDWVWIAGNHDPEPERDVGGVFAREMRVGPLVLRHEPAAGHGVVGEIAGHLHPCARVVQRGRSLTRRCFAGDGRRMVMPAFGAFTGGLNVRHAAFEAVFDGTAFTTHLIGDSRLYTFPAARCVG